MRAVAKILSFTLLFGFTGTIHADSGSFLDRMRSGEFEGASPRSSSSPAVGSARGSDRERPRVRGSFRTHMAEAARSSDPRAGVRGSSSYTRYSLGGSSASGSSVRGSSSSSVRGSLSLSDIADRAARKSFSSDDSHREGMPREGAIDLETLQTKFKFSVRQTKDKTRPKLTGYMSKACAPHFLITVEPERPRDDKDVPSAREMNMIITMMAKPGTPAECLANLDFDRDLKDLPMDQRMYLDDMLLDHERDNLDYYNHIACDYKVFVRTYSTEDDAGASSDAFLPPTSTSSATPLRGEISATPASTYKFDAACQAFENSLRVCPDCTVADRRGYIEDFFGALQADLYFSASDTALAEVATLDTMDSLVDKAREIEYMRSMSPERYGATADAILEEIESRYDDLVKAELDTMKEDIRKAGSDLEKLLALEEQVYELTGDADEERRPDLARIREDFFEELNKAYVKVMDSADRDDIEGAVTDYARFIRDNEEVLAEIDEDFVNKSSRDVMEAIRNSRNLGNSKVTFEQMDNLETVAREFHRDVSGIENYESDEYTATIAAIQGRRVRKMPGSQEERLEQLGKAKENLQNLAHESGVSFDDGDSRDIDHLVAQVELKEAQVHSQNAVRAAVGAINPFDPWSGYAAQQSLAWGVGSAFENLYQERHDTYMSACYGTSSGSASWGPFWVGGSYSTGGPSYGDFDGQMACSSARSQLSQVNIAYQQAMSMGNNALNRFQQQRFGAQGGVGGAGGAGGTNFFGASPTAGHFSGPSMMNMTGFQDPFTRGSLLNRI